MWTTIAVSAVAALNWAVLVPDGRHALAVAGAVFVSCMAVSVIVREAVSQERKK